MKKLIQSWRTRLSNRYVRWYNDRQENKKRHWRVCKTFGGSFPIGRCNMSEAVEIASKHGPVIHVDIEVATVFVSNDP